MYLETDGADVVQSTAGMRAVSTASLRPRSPGAARGGPGADRGGRGRTGGTGADRGRPGQTGALHRGLEGSGEQQEESATVTP